MGHGADPCRAVDREADVALAGGHRLSRVDPDPDPHLDSLGPLLVAHGPLERNGGSDGIRGAPERDEERVALGVDLLAAVRREDAAEQHLLVGEQLAVPLPAEPFEQARRALDVGKDEGDGATGPLSVFTPARLSQSGSLCQRTQGRGLRSGMSRDSGNGTLGWASVLSPDLPLKRPLAGC